MLKFGWLCIKLVDGVNKETTTANLTVLSWSFSTSGIGKVTRCFHPKTLGPAILFAEKFRLVDLPQDFHHGGIGVVFLLKILIVDIWLVVHLPGL